MLNILKILPLLFLLFTNTGCVEKHLFTKSTDYYLALNKSEVNKEIHFLEDSLKKNKNAEQKVPTAETYLYLSLLYSHSNNPEPDFDKAINALDQYEKLSQPQKNIRLEIQHIKKLLNATNCPERVQEVTDKNRETYLQKANMSLVKDKEALQHQCTTLRQEIDILTKENQTMKNLINQLKQLDIEIEQKKRAIR